MSDEMGGGGAAVDGGGSSGGNGADASAAASGTTASAGNFVPNGDGAPDDEATESGDDGETDGAKKAAAKAVAKFKIKRGGKDAEGTLEDLQKWASDDYEHELTVDGNVEKLRYPDLIARARLGGAAFNRMRAAKEAEARYQSQERELLANPVGIFERAGLDPVEWAIKQVQEQVQLEQMQATDPRGYADRMVERKMRMAEIKAQRENEAKQMQAQAAERTRQRRALYEALPGALGAKMSPTLNGIIGQLMHDAERGGHTPEVAELAMLAKSQLRRDMQTMVADMPPDAIRELLGDAALKKLRQSDAASLREAEKKKLGIGNGGNPPGMPGARPSTPTAQKPTAQQILRNVLGGKH